MKKINKKAVLGLGILFVTAAVFTVVRMALAAPSQPVHSIELTSQNTSFANNEPGAWKITKWAGWSSKTTARVVFDIESVLKKKNEHDDVIFVADMSNSTIGKLDEIKRALSSIANHILDDPESSVSLVQFSSQYEILSGFNNNKDETTSRINSLDIEGLYHDYYQGLNGAEMLLRNYDYVDNHSVTIVMIITGEPNEETMFQKAQYRLIKSKYPFVTINAVQLGMGNGVSDLMRSSSDNQFVSNMDNFEDMAYSAAISAYFYDSFEITDYINTDYFEINPNSAPYTTNGTINVDNDTVTLTMVDQFRTGGSVQFEIDLKLKDGVESPDDLYPTNKKAEVRSVLFDTASENIVSNDSPILKRRYSVYYNPNQPNDCTVSGVPENPERYLVYTSAEISNTTPTCSGYNFAGYEISTSGVRKMNDDFFWMPERDVEIAATWTKVDIEKRMDGEIFDVKYLYDEIAKKSMGNGDNYNLDNFVDFSSEPSESNGEGVMTLSSTALDEYPIHYYRGKNYNNNVFFGGSCWIIARTTELGGVKLLYNGQGYDGNCASRRDHMGFIYRSTAVLTTNYYYGTDFVYENGKYSLAGEITVARYNGNNIETIRGKYTCLSASIDATCSTLYLVDDAYNSASAYMLRLTNTSDPSIGSFEYNGNARSLSRIGYMKNNDLDLFGSTSFQSGSGSGSKRVLSSSSLSTNYWYADSADYNDDVYELNNPFKVSSTNEYADLVGKYTFRDSSHDYTNNIVYYIVGVENGTMYYLELSNGQTLEDVDASIPFGEDIIENPDGSYSLTNPFFIKLTEWPTRYSEASGMFTCATSFTTCNDPYYVMYDSIDNYSSVAISKQIVLGKSHNDLELLDTVTIPFYLYKQNYQYYMDNGYIFTCGYVDPSRVSTTCRVSDLKIIIDPSERLYTYLGNYYFGSSVEWNGSNYTLVDTIGLENYNNIDTLSTHHYFCPTAGQTTCPEVRYIHYHSGTTAYYVAMKNGVTMPEEIIAQSRTNEIDSTMKNAIDRWYERNLIDYTDKLEDTVFCNDRSIHQIGGWTVNGRLDEEMIFGASARNMVSGASPDLSCANPEDAFTVSTENGNGKLSYPVGLLSADEAIMMGSGEFSSGIWTMSPFNFYSNISNAIIAKDGENLLSEAPFTKTIANRARPSIALKNGAFITGGDGTIGNPWTVGWE